MLRVAADPMALMLAAAAAVYFALGERTDAIVVSDWAIAIGIALLAVCWTAFGVASKKSRIQS